MTPLLSIFSSLLGCDSDTGLKAVEPTVDEIPISPSTFTKLCSPFSEAGYVYNEYEGGFDSKFVASRVAYKEKYDTAVESIFTSVSSYEAGTESFTVLIDSVLKKDAKSNKIGQIFIFAGDKRAALKNWFFDGTYYQGYGMAHFDFSYYYEEIIPNEVGIACRFSEYEYESSDHSYSRTESNISYFAGDFSSWENDADWTLEKLIDDDGDISLRLSGFRYYGYYYESEYSDYILTNSLSIYDSTLGAIDEKTSSMAKNNLTNSNEDSIKRSIYYCGPDPNSETGTPKCVEYLGDE